MTATAAELPRSPAGLGAAMRGAVATFLARPLVWVLVVVWLLQIAVFAYAINAALYSQDPGSVGSDFLRVEEANVWPLASMPAYGSFVFVLLGALAGASDYRYGTFRLILPRYPFRASLLGARVVCLVLLSAAVSVLTMVVSFAMSAVVSSAVDLEVRAPAVADTVLALGLGWLIVLAMTALGFAASLLLRSLLGGFLAGFLWVVGVELLMLAMLAPLADWLDTLRGVLPTGAASSLVVALAGHTGTDLPTVPGVSSELVAPGMAVAALLAWTVVLFGTAILLFQRRDV